MRRRLKILNYSSHSASAARVKDKLLIDFIGITSLFAVFYVIISAIIRYYHGVFVMSINFALFVTIFALFARKTISYKTAANLYIGNCTFVAILLCTYFSGGLFSPVLPWFILIPTISMLLLGMNRNSWVWLSITITIIITIGILSIAGYKYPVAYDTSWSNFFFVTCLGGLGLIVFIVTMVFEKEKDLAFSKLAQKNKEVTDSIAYAKRIQDTLLTPQEFIGRHFPEHFILYVPKDIVSGDFYWVTERNNNVYLAVCDCTGHGVPGAFMSLLITNFLNEAINERSILDPNKIFDFVRGKIIEHVSKDGGKDGMDGIILRLNKLSGEITFASANSNQVIVRNRQLIKLPKDKMPVGHGEKMDPFNLYTLLLQPGDTLYLYTDGFADLFGGPRGKKFTYRQLNERLVNISGMNLDEQRQELENVMHTWRGDLEQIDDICLMGIRMP